MSETDNVRQLLVPFARIADHMDVFLGDCHEAIEESTPHLYLSLAWMTACALGAGPDCGFFTDFPQACLV